MLKAFVAAFLCAGSLAQAATVNFEQPVDFPFIFAGDHVQFGQFWVEAYGGELTSDLVGMVIDGSSSDICFGISCPVNNPSMYYAGLDDGYFYFGNNDDSLFKVTSLQASFIGAGQDSYPPVSGILLLQGFGADGKVLGPDLQVPLAGPINGQFSFAGYNNLGAFSDQYYSFVRVLGFACDSDGNCNRNTNQANFGIDNIQTSSFIETPSPMPEPTTWALIGSGLAGLMFARRRDPAAPVRPTPAKPSDRHYA
jgi:hypothetical protein